MSNCCSNFHMSFCPCPWMKRNIRLGWQFQSDKNYAIDSAYSVLCKSLDCARFHCGPHHRTEMIVEGPFEKIDFWFILAKHFFGNFFFCSNRIDWLLWRWMPISAVRWFMSVKQWQRFSWANKVVHVALSYSYIMAVHPATYVTFTWPKKLEYRAEPAHKRGLSARSRDVVRDGDGDKTQFGQAKQTVRQTEGQIDRPITYLCTNKPAQKVAYKSAHAAGSLDSPLRALGTAIWLDINYIS